MPICKKNLIHIIWDLDGTLIDSQEEILSTIKLALLDSGINIDDCKKKIKIGPPLEIMLKELFDDNYLSDTKLKEIVTHFRRRYDNSDYNLTLSFPGIDDIIFDNNFVHHIVTNKPEYATNKILKKLNWTDRITSIYSTAVRDEPQGQQRITKAELFKKIIIGYSRNENIFFGIGDMRNDCIAANVNNIFTIGVIWGSGIREELNDVCDYVVINTKELHSILTNRITRFSKDQK